MHINCLNILVTGIGGDLGQAIAKSVRLVPERCRLVGCDSDGSGVGSAFVDVFEMLPTSDSPDFSAHLIDLCRRHRIDAIIPGCVPDARRLPVLFPDRVLPCGIPIVCQSAEWFQRFDDKLETFLHLEGTIPLARFYDGNAPDTTDKVVRDGALPCIVKPRRSSGSRSIIKAGTGEELRSALQNMPDAVVQEYIDDTHGEFSVGVFRWGGQFRAIAFRRTFGRAGGATWYADNFNQPNESIAYARQIAEATQLEGSCNIQLRISSRGPLLLEINPRFSSLAAARAACGFCDVAWALAAAMGSPPAALPNHFRSLRFQRYFHELLDLGDGYRGLEEWNPALTRLAAADSDTRRGLPVTNSSIRLGADFLGPGHPAYIVAEISANHNQSIAKAREIISAAHAAGADAVKLQTYRPDTITLDCDSPEFRVCGNAWEGRRLFDLYADAMTPWEWHAELKMFAEELGLALFSSPFDHSAVDFLEELNVPAYKVASFELVDLPLIRKITATGKPVIMSTGMATLEEIDEAVQCFREAGGRDLILLKCTSAYPALPEEANLRTIPDMAERFGCPVGLSDHTLGSACAVGAVALGACVIEKHLTISRADGGPDSGFSMEPEEFRVMVENIRNVQKALGNVSYDLTPSQSSNRAYRRSLFVTSDVQRGELFTLANVRSVRPGTGLAPKHLEEVLGCRAAQDIACGTPLRWELLERK